MRTVPQAAVSTSTAGRAVTHDAKVVEFVDLLVADDEWVRSEFEAIVDAGWGGAVPPCPPLDQGAREPRRHRYDGRPTPVQGPCELLARGAAPARQRGPPRNRSALADR